MPSRSSLGRRLRGSALGMRGIDCSMAKGIANRDRRNGISGPDERVVFMQSQLGSAW